jgi:hypothetical protein
MQFVKGYQNGYLVPGGIAGPPFPVGYKYGGLVLQVRRLGNGLTTCHIKKMTVREVKIRIGLGAV